MTSKEEIAGWLKYGEDIGYKYMAVVCDTYDYEDFPSFYNSKEDLDDFIKNLDGMNKLMETYNLTADIESQLMKSRTFA